MMTALHRHKQKRTTKLRPNLNRSDCYLQATGFKNAISASLIQFVPVSNCRADGREMGAEMKIIVLATSALAIGCSSGLADELVTSRWVESARFAAMSITKDESARAIISNVLVAGDGADLTPCQVRVSFFSADGSLIGNATTVELKAGELISVPAAQPSKLMRATVSIGDIANTAKVCALRTNIEIFDVQTGTTFVSVPGEFIGRNSECSVAMAPPDGATRKSESVREKPAPVAISSSPWGRRVSPKTKPPVLAATRPTGSR